MTTEIVAVPLAKDKENLILTEPRSHLRNTRILQSPYREEFVKRLID